VEVGISGNLTQAGDEAKGLITLTNPSNQVAFFLRVEVTRGRDGQEVLPMTYEDNYVTVFPGESQTLWARFRTADLDGKKPYLRVEGYNVNLQNAEIE